MGRRPASEPALTIGAIEELMNKGYNGNEIADMFGVSRQAVSWHRKNYTSTRTPRELVNEHFPWKVPHELNQQSPYRRLRDHGEYMATGGKGMSADKLQRLRTFYRKLINGNLVVEFDPTLPPVPGVANKGGFAFRSRKARDGDLIIRINNYTVITDEGRMIWRLPPTLP